MYNNNLFTPENYPMHSWVKMQEPQGLIEKLEDWLDWILGNE